METVRASPLRRWTVRIAVLLGLAACYALLRFTVWAPEPVEVRVVAVEHGPVEATVTNSKAGTLRARRRARVTAEIGGRVIEVARREGDKVQAGDVIVRLNDSSLRAQLELAEKAVVVSAVRVEEACLRRDRAGRELARTKKLAERNIASEDVLDELQYANDAAGVACTAAGAEMDRAKANVRAAETEVAKSVVVAPFDGVVAEVNAEVGEWVTPSPPLLTSPAVADVIDLTSLYVSAPMDEVDSGQIRPGQAAKLTIDSSPGAEFAGHVTRVAPYVLDIEAQNRTVEIEVEFDDAALASGFLPGTSADVEVVLQVRDGVLRVPTSALLENNRVLLFEDGVLVERPVQLGLRNWNYAELLDGLELGDQVVVSLDRVEVKAGADAVTQKSAASPGR